MDTWQGRSYDPETLNKYLYTHADPLNGTDPSGYETLLSLNTAGSVNNILAGSVLASVAYGVYMTGEALSDNSAFRSFAAWDVLAISQFKARTEVSTSSDAHAKAEEKRKLNNSPRRHHVIPTYLCGANSQEMSTITHGQHVAIHAEIATISFALKGAEKYANSKVGYKRTELSLKIAQTEQGRNAIALGLQQMYQFGGWWAVGQRPIGQVFASEKGPYVSGAKTSLPTCARVTSTQ